MVRVGDVDVPVEGTEVTFRLDCVPVVKTRGKRKLVDMTEAFIVSWFMDRIGTALTVSTVAARPLSFTINKDGIEPFTRPYARVIGTGTVLDVEALGLIMRRGLGDAKAYGFGLMELERKTA